MRTYICDIFLTSAPLYGLENKCCFKVCSVVRQHKRSDDAVRGWREGKRKEGRRGIEGILRGEITVRQI